MEPYYADEDDAIILEFRCMIRKRVKKLWKTRSELHWSRLTEMKYTAVLEAKGIPVEDQEIWVRVSRKRSADRMNPRHDIGRNAIKIDAGDSNGHLTHGIFVTDSR